MTTRSTEQVKQSRGVLRYLVMGGIVIGALVGHVFLDAIGRTTQEMVVAGPNEDSAELLRQSIAARLNANLPKKVDEETTLRQITFERGQMHYHFTISGMRRPDMMYLKETNLKQKCAGFLYLLKRGAASSVLYEYNTGTQSLSYRLTERDCNGLGA